MPVNLTKAVRTYVTSITPKPADLHTTAKVDKISRIARTNPTHERDTVEIMTAAGKKVLQGETPVELPDPGGKGRFINLRV